LGLGDVVRDHEIVQLEIHVLAGRGGVAGLTAGGEAEVALLAVLADRGGPALREHGGAVGGERGADEQVDERAEAGVATCAWGRRRPIVAACSRTALGGETMGRSTM